MSCPTRSVSEAIAGASDTTLLNDLDDDSTDKVIKVKYSFSLLDETGDPVPSFTRTSQIRSFSSSNPSSGFVMFIKRAELESSQYLRDDTASGITSPSSRRSIPRQPPPPRRSYM
ncbi:hypothetical protein PR202_ga31285 [Eleusine coracana subsp. coracana]|uniref:MATH domain-containing protein n=1 Tax=Eleusine coracana subsp. coracana TaxID=191504 RepID=A0AAV5DRT3_ELECO|nr:hypothetical protein PR202_ga31285 [Eleusine coracana subsp. coracana]